jgi:predicted phage tail protein
MNDIKHRIYLHGSLAEVYGYEPFTLYGISVQDVMQGMIANLGAKFKERIKEGEWHVTRGTRSYEVDHATPMDSFLNEEEVALPLLDEEIHIFPVLGGAGRGVGQIILGVVLIIVAIVFWWAGGLAWGGAAAAASLAGPTALAGVMSVLGGIVSMVTSPSIESPQNAQVDQKNSFIYNGPVNNVEQGVPVPLIFGRHMAGTTVLSGSISSEQTLQSNTYASGNVVSITHTGPYAKVTMDVPHNMTNGMRVTVSGATGADQGVYNGTFSVFNTNTDKSIFYYQMSETPLSDAQGTLYVKVTP